MWRLQLSCDTYGYHVTWAGRQVEAAGQQLVSSVCWRILWLWWGRNVKIVHQFYHGKSSFLPSGAFRKHRQCSNQREGKVSAGIFPRRTYSNNVIIFYIILFVIYILHFYDCLLSGYLYFCHLWIDFIVVKVVVKKICISTPNSFIGENVTHFFCVSKKDD